jgi:DNA-binding NtrC family response regulator
MLQAHAWPGNVRELRNTVSRLMLFPEALEEAIVRGAAPTGVVSGLPWREAREAAIAEFEQRYLAARLKEHKGNVSRAAESLGVSRQFLHRLLARYNLGDE